LNKNLLIPDPVVESYAKTELSFYLWLSKTEKDPKVSEFVNFAVSAPEGNFLDSH